MDKLGGGETPKLKIPYIFKRYATIASEDRDLYGAKKLMIGAIGDRK